MQVVDHTGLSRAQLALDGLSVGDAFGKRMTHLEGETRARLIEAQRLPTAPWLWTDDTLMAASLLESLRKRGRIDQDLLVESLAKHFDPDRSYGEGVALLLNQVRDGGRWRPLAKAIFRTGNYGNTVASRVPPVGAYFAEDLDAVVHEARLSAEVTHTHPEGIAGAVAVALAAAIAWRSRDEKPSYKQFLGQVLLYLTESEVYDGIKRAHDLPDNTSPETAAVALGRGANLTCQDTVPFALWCAAEHLRDFEAAQWAGVSAGGDSDTICAIVGAVVALYRGREALPAAWLSACEPLPKWG